MTRTVPVVKIAGDANQRGVGRPHGKAHPLYAFTQRHLCSERAIALVVGAFAMQVQLEGSEQGREAKGILEVERFPGIKLDPKAVTRRAVGKGGDEESSGMHPLHRRGFV